MFEIPRFLPDCVFQAGARNDKHLAVCGGGVRRLRRRTPHSL